MYKVGDIVTIRNHYTNHYFSIGEQVKIINIRNEALIASERHTHVIYSTFKGIEYHGVSISTDHDWAFWIQDIINLKQILSEL